MLRLPGGIVRVLVEGITRIRRYEYYEHGPLLCRGL